MSKNYTYVLTFDQQSPKGEWRILNISEVSAMQAMFDPTKIVFRYPYAPDDEGTNVPPAAVRFEYEGLINRPEFIGYDDPPEMPNLVEMVVDDECAFDQPCAFGRHVQDYAIYCHNEKWLYAPCKCHRNLTDWPHNKCRGFKPNPFYSPAHLARP